MRISFYECFCVVMVFGGKYDSFSLLYFYLGGEGVNAMTVLSYI